MTCLSLFGCIDSGRLSTYLRLPLCLDQRRLEIPTRFDMSPEPAHEEIEEKKDGDTESAEDVSPRRTSDDDDEKAIPANLKSNDGSTEYALDPTHFLPPANLTTTSESNPYFVPDLSYTAQEESAVIRILDIRLFPWILLTTFVLNMDRTNISNAISDNMPGDLGFNINVVNTSLAVYSVFFSVTCLTGAVVAKIMGPARCECMRMIVGLKVCD